MIAPRLIAESLCADGWQEESKGFLYYRKRIARRAAPGSFSPDGGRIVTLRLDPPSYGLERVGPWGEVERRANLRDFGTAQEAIAAAMA